MWLGKGTGIPGFLGEKGGCRLLVGSGRGPCGSSS